MWTGFDLVVSAFMYDRLRHTLAHLFSVRGAHKLGTVPKAGSWDPASLQSDQRISTNKGARVHLRKDAAEGSQHGPACMQHLNDPVAGEGLGVC